MSHLFRLDEPARLYAIVVQAAAGRLPAAVASSRMPGSICCSAIEEMPSRMNRVGLSILSKKRSPASMITLRHAAASARAAASVPRGPSSHSDVPPAESVERHSGRNAEIAWTNRLRRSSKAADSRRTSA